MPTFKEGSVVVVTTKESNQIGVVFKIRRINKQVFYDVLLESRLVITHINMSTAAKKFINRNLTSLVINEDFQTTIPYQDLVERGLLPYTE